MIAAKGLILLFLLFGGLSPRSMNMLEKGLLLLEAGRSDEAAAVLTELCKAEPSMPEAHYYLGRARFLSGDFGQAEAAFLRTLELSPGLDDARRRLGEAQLMQGKNPEAARTLETFLQLHPDEADAWFLKAQAEEKSGRQEQAVASLRRALVVKPGFAEARVNLGALLLDLDRLPEAEAEFRRALASGNLGDDSALALVDALEEKKEFQRALALLSLLESSRSDGAGRYALARGRLHLLAREFPEAVQAFGRACDCTKGSFDCLFGLGAAFQELGDWKNAAVCMDTAAAMTKGDPETLFQAALSAGMAGNLEREEQYYRKVLELSPSHADSLHNLALLLDKSGRQAEAGPIWEKYLKAAPASGTALLALARLKAKEGANADAARYFRLALASREDWVPAMRDAAAFFHLSGEKRTARELYYRIRTLAQADARALHDLALLEVDDGNLDQALSLLGEAAAAREPPCDVWVSTAGVLERLGRLEESLEAMEKARSCGVSGTGIEVSETRLLLDRGEYPRVIRLVDERIKRRQAGAEDRYYKARALALTGAVEQALPEYREALRLAPDNLKLKVEYVRALAASRRCDEALEFLGGVEAKLGTAQKAEAGEVREQCRKQAEAAKRQAEAVVAAEQRKEVDTRRQKINEAVAARRHAEAAGLLAELLNEQAEDVPALRIAASVALKQNDRAGAAGFLRRIVGLDAKDLESRLVLARLQVEGGALDEGERLFLQVLEAEPGNAKALLEMGLLADRRGDQAQAEAWYTRALASAPAADLYHRRAVARSKQKKGREAAADLEECLKLEPEQKACLAGLVMMYRAAGRGDEAMKMLARLRKVDPSRAAELEKAMKGKAVRE